MDTFVEQIIAMKKTSKTWLAYAGITIAAIMLMTVAFIFLNAIFIPIDFLIFFFAYKLYMMQNVEYEYILTNSAMDIDKIIAKSSRKRVLSFDLSAVQKIARYDGTLPYNAPKDIFFACNKNDENAVILFYKKEGHPQKAVIFSPNEKMVDGMKKFLPRHICENL